MKTNKFFATALAVLALAGFTACDQPTPTEPLELTETSVTLKVGETHQLTANVAVESWTSSNEAVATVADGLVTAVSAGNAIISATAAGVTKTCVVLVEASGSTSGGTVAQVKGTKIWPIVLDAVTAEANAAKIVGDLRTDDTNNFLDVWAKGETYVAGDGTGLNFHGNNEGYVALTVAAPDNWSGGGFRLGATSAAAADELRKLIVANPDKYFLHIGMKATTTGNHQFYTFSNAATSFAIGTATIEAGTVVGDFTRDGSWAEFDIPMANFATILAGITIPASDGASYILSFLSGGNKGSQLNLDAVYFYEK